MANRNRDEFKKPTREKIARQAGWLCSDPSCRRSTVGSNSDGTGEIMLGTAAHICAAAPDGPRYDPQQTPEQRRSADNGIWLCRNHGTAVDAKDPKYTVQLLHEWKAQAQKESWRRVLYHEVSHSASGEKLSQGEVGRRLRVAARADLDVYRRSGKWPQMDIALTMEVEGLSEPVSAVALAKALTTLDDLVLVAPPGMGKTTTLFQIAEAVLANDEGVPIVVPLADWSTQDTPLLESVLRRPAFRGVTEDDLRAATAKRGVVMLLDGWNELDAGARTRLTAQVERLKAELPELSLLISTREQALDVPVDGTRVALLPLREAQQVELARGISGDMGVRMVDQAWRTAGVREMVTIPLYLKALLTLPEDAPFPKTKEEVLRRFVAVHERDARHAAALAEVMHGLHQRFLEDLAVVSTRALSTSLGEPSARKSIAETDEVLLAEGQLTEKPQPKAVLDALVSHHVLTRVGDPTGYSFQHQQLQEWYASHFVARLMLSSINDAGSRDNLKINVLNQPVWEESTLFACERLARGAPRDEEACATAILAAFEVDPLLAGEMVFRANDAVWARIGTAVQVQIRKWHAPGKVDRAVRFMITSGRPEFLDLVWPLITHKNNQISLRALRSGKRFRPSILGGDASKRVEALPSEVRRILLSEMAHNSGIDGMDLATSIAKNDHDSKVQASVVDALAFRRGDQHVAELLRCAGDETFDIVVRSGVVDEVEIADEKVRKGIEAARARRSKDGSTYARLREIVHAQSQDDRSDELTAIIAEMEFSKDGHEHHLLYEARNRYLHAIAEGLLQRVRVGRDLYYGADDLLASSNLNSEDEELFQLALSTNRRDWRAEAAATVLGSKSVGRLIETAFEAKTRVRDPSGKYDQAAAERHSELLARIAHTRGASLLAAVVARSAGAGNEEIADLAHLISRHPDGDRGRPFGADDRIAIGALAEDWGNRMLAAGDSTRLQLASIAGLIRRASSVKHLPLLKRLLDENLRRYRAFREEAHASGWRQGPAVNEAQSPLMTEYLWAFQAINAPETAVLAQGYLQDQYFGEEAAQVLASQWNTKNPSGDEARFGGGVDFSRVEEKRAARAHDPAATSSEAEAIFSAIEPFIVDGASDDQKKHAIALGIVGVALPHGQRGETIKKLISLAPRRARAALLRNLVLSGEAVDIGLVKDGIAEVFKAAESQKWILHEGWELMDWLRLLPFTNRPAEALALINDLPEDQRRRDRLEELITTFGAAPGDEVENVLFQLAGVRPKLYASHSWRAAVLSRGTISASRRFIDLAASGAFDEGGPDRWTLAREIGGLMSRFPELRAHVYGLLKNGATSSGINLLAQAVAEHPDADGMLILIKMEIERNQKFTSWKSVENVVTQHVPSEEWKGSFNIVPIPAGDLRRQLLSLTTDGGPADAAARCLTAIDNVRDEYGTADSEPRHPDVESGKAWPIMRPHLTGGADH